MALHPEKGGHFLAVAGLATGQEVERLETGFLMPVMLSLAPLLKIVDLFSRGWNRDAHGLPSRLRLSQRLWRVATLCTMFYRNSYQIQQYRLDLHREQLPVWGGAGQLIATRPTEPLGLAGGGAVIDEPITLALGTDRHSYSPSQRWAYLATRGGTTRRKT
jgi:hypothetical protein